MYTTPLYLYISKKFEQKFSGGRVLPNNTARETVRCDAGTCTDLAKARSVRAAKANQRAIDLAPTIEELRLTGAFSLRAIAAGLNVRGITTPRGHQWSASQVRNLLKRAALPIVEVPRLKS